VIDCNSAARIWRKLYGVRRANCRQKGVKCIPRAALEKGPSFTKDRANVLEVLRPADIPNLFFT
jgi:hypothetical protein